MEIFQERYWEGLLIDLWSIPHLMFGVVVSLILIYYFNKNIWSSLVIVFVLATAWEIVEHFIGVREYFINRVVDIFLPLLSVAAVHAMYKLMGHHRSISFWVLTASVIFFIFTSLIGWIAYIQYS